MFIVIIINYFSIVPEDLFDPIVTPISSSELNVQWTEPAKSNGVITLYQIFIQYNNSSTNSVTNSTSIGSHVVVGLSPFTSYGFYVQVCNTAGCTSSSIAVNTTLESGMCKIIKTWRYYY